MGRKIIFIVVFKHLLPRKRGIDVGLCHVAPIPHHVPVAAEAENSGSARNGVALEAGGAKGRFLFQPVRKRV